MARVVAFVPDLLFGSNVVGALQAGGHDPVLVSAADQLPGALAGADVLIVDLTDDVDARIAATRDAGVKTLAFFSHVAAEVKAWRPPPALTSSSRARGWHGRRRRSSTSC